jgi:hypothetical protein
VPRHPGADAPVASHLNCTGAGGRSDVHDEEHY